MISRLYSTPVRPEPVLSVRSRSYRGLVVRGWLAILLLGIPGVVLAQAGVGSTTITPKIALQLFDDLDDIDRLRSLNPLKLTPEELDKTIAAISAARDAYDKQTADLAVAQVTKLVDEIKEVKRKMLAGGKLPADFDERVQKASAGFIAARGKLDAENLGKMADVLREILTPTQIAAAVKVSKAAAVAAGKQTTGADTLWFNYYVKEIIIGYPRILPLLKEMRGITGQDAKTAKVGDANSGGAASGNGAGGPHP